jgi:hypothetical protein
MTGDQIGSPKSCLPIALTAGDEDDLARLVGEPIERLLGGVVATSFRGSRTRIGEHVGLHASLVGSCSATVSDDSTVCRACTMTTISLCMARLGGVTRWAETRTVGWWPNTKVWFRGLFPVARVSPCALCNRFCGSVSVWVAAFPPPFSAALWRRPSGWT